MEVFSKLLQKGVEECTNFKHHSKCAALKLTYLCFAEDLTVFLGADVHSVQVVLEALGKFTRLLWLRENFTKSEIFIAATPPSLKKKEIEFAPVQRRKASCHIPWGAFNFREINRKRFQATHRQDHNKNRLMGNKISLICKQTSIDTIRHLQSSRVLVQNVYPSQKGNQSC